MNLFRMYAFGYGRKSRMYRNLKEKYPTTLIDITLLKSLEHNDLSKDPVLYPNVESQRLHTVFPIIVQKSGSGDFYWVRDGCRRTKRAYDLGHTEMTSYILPPDSRYYNSQYDEL